MAAAVACGGAGSAGSPEAEIRQTWTTFFSNRSDVDQKLAVLENGAEFRDVIANVEQSRLPEQASATVSRVMVHGDTADVTYTIFRGSTPELTNVTGLAVRTNGAWKVSDRTLCSLLALGYAPPPQCSSTAALTPTP